MNKFKNMMIEGRESEIFIEETLLGNEEFFFDSRPLKMELDEISSRIPTNSPLQPILQTLFNILKNQHVEVVYADKKVMEQMSTGYAYYDHQLNKVFLPDTISLLKPIDSSYSKQEMIAMVILHETIHQITTKALHKNYRSKTAEEKLFQERVHKLLDLYIEKVPENKMPNQLKEAVIKYKEMWAKMLPAEKENWNYEGYAEEMDHILDEFLAYGLTYKSVMKQLEGITVQEEGPLFEGTMLSNLIKAIVDLFSSLMDKVLGKNAKQLLEATFEDFVKNNVSLDRTLTDIIDFRQNPNIPDQYIKFYKSLSEKTRAKKKC